MSGKGRKREPPSEEGRFLGEGGAKEISCSQDEHPLSTAAIPAPDNDTPQEQPDPNAEPLRLRHETFPPEFGDVKVTPLYDSQDSVTELRARDELFRTALSFGHFMIYELRLMEGAYILDDNVPMAVGGTLEDIPPGTPTTSWWTALVHPEHQSRMWDMHDNQVLGAAEYFNMEYQVRHKSGEYLWFRSLSKALHRDSLGRATRIVGVITDVDVHKRREVALNKNIRELEANNEHLKEMLRQTSLKLERASMEILQQQQQLTMLNVNIRVLQNRLESKQPSSDEDKVIAGNLAHLFLPSLESLRNKQTSQEGREITDALLRQVTDISATLSPNLKSHYASLSPRESQIADLIRIGKDTKTIAVMLGLSTRSVETHRYNIRKKFDLRDTKTSLRTFLNFIV